MPGAVRKREAEGLFTDVRIIFLRVIWGRRTVISQADRSEPIDRFGKSLA
jgi:hypothetical protein